tara:strand:+ start:652 stop:1050 length:399 start_codon:yes stop_codon:yes gene_type:complete
MMDKNYFVYLLKSTSGSTYIGATVNLERRLRQHNGEIVGGAISTSIKVKKGELWKRVCYIYNFPNWRSALQFEWKWKRLSKKFNRLNPLEKRFRALDLLFSLDKPTKKAIPFCEWNKKPEVYIDLEEVYDYY